MSKHVLSFADKKLAGEISAPEVLTPLVPRLADYYEGLHNYSDMVNEISVVGNFTRKAGFTPGKDFQRVANIPSSLRAALLEIDPDLFTNKAKFYSWLNSEAGQPYDLRGKITL